MKPSKKILVSGPSISKKEIEFVAAAAQSAWNENAYYFIRQFEKKFADFVGTKYAVATSSCTGALHLALLALNIGKGDEVIVPDSTWIASVAPIIYVGAKPVFVDSDEKNWCINPEKIEEKITKKTKAILPVHLYGNPCDMEKILKIAKKQNLKVIEDAAESLGSTFQKRMTGSFGDIGCFSFHGSKMMVTGEGGMLVTNSKKIYERVKFLNDHGKSRKKMFWNLEVAYKYKMSDLQAAFGLAQLERIQDLLGKKRKIFSWYKKYLEKIPGIMLNPEIEGSRNNFWMTTIILDKKYRLDKLKLMKKLAEKNIDSRPFFYALTQLPPFKNENAEKQHPVAYRLSKYGINLPCGLEITEKEVRYICASLIEILKNSK